MKKFIKNIWSDPVGSKVVANLIWIILTALAIGIYSLIAQIPILEVLNPKIELYWILIGIVILLFIRILWRRKNNDVIDPIEQIKDRIRTFNEITFGEVLWRWHISFTSSNQFFIDNLRPYCLKHHRRVNMQEYHDSYKCLECGQEVLKHHSEYPINRNTTKDLVEVRNYIGSEIENRWDDLVNEFVKNSKKIDSSNSKI